MSNAVAEIDVTKMKDDGQRIFESSEPSFVKFVRRLQIHHYFFKTSQL